MNNLPGIAGMAPHIVDGLHQAHEFVMVGSMMIGVGMIATSIMNHANSHRPMFSGLLAGAVMAAPQILQSFPM